MERKVHTAEHMASAMFCPGCAHGGDPASQAGSDRRSFADPRRGRILHPVAATPDKTWRPDGFLAVAAHLKRTGIEPVFIGAQSDDLSAFQSYRLVQGSPLSEIKALLATASFFVGNDSGPAHMAAAFGVPVVAIFGDFRPRHLGTVAHTIGSGDVARRYRARRDIAGAGSARATAGARMKELLRLLSYARRYSGI